MYELNADASKSSKSTAKASKEGDVDLSLNPDEVGQLGEEGLRAKYEEHLRKQKGGGADDGEDARDFSDLVAEHAARQKVDWLMICFGASLR